MNFRSIKVQLAFFLALFALYLSIAGNNIFIFRGILLALVFSIAAESAVLYLKTRKFQVTESSFVTGLIIGYVLAGDQPWWAFLAASFLAIISKHLIKINKRHIFNPAALGVFLVVLIFKIYTEWKGAYVWYLVIPAGIYFAYRIRKLDLVASYFVVSLMLFIPLTVMRHIAVINILGYFNYFFIFIMLIEPKTTPAGTLPKVLFGGGAALLIIILMEVGFGYEAELFALLVMNSAVLLLRKYRRDSKKNNT